MITEAHGLLSSGHPHHKPVTDGDRTSGRHRRTPTKFEDPAYGDFYASSSYVTNKVLSKDLAADGNTIYTEGIWYWTGPNYASQGSYNTPEHNRTYYVTNYKSNVLVGPADKVRATTKACVQLGWPVPDKCSVAAYATVTY